MAISEDNDDGEPSDGEILEHESSDESDQASESELCKYTQHSSQDQLAKWVESQCMAILEDWGSTSKHPAFSTYVHEQHIMHRILV